MERQTPITEKTLQQQGFQQVLYKNKNDDSDPTRIVVYQKGDIALMNFGPCWIVCETGFGPLLIKEPILTMEELIEGMNTHGLALGLLLIIR